MGSVYEFGPDTNTNPASLDERIARAFRNLNDQDPELAAGIRRIGDQEYEKSNHSFEAKVTAIAYALRDLGLLKTQAEIEEVAALDEQFALPTVEGSDNLKTTN